MSKLSVKNLGTIALIGAIYFFLSFIILGFIQPGYNHFRDTVSALVSGKYGWAQTLSFIILALSTLPFTYGLKTSLLEEKSRAINTTLFLIFSGTTVVSIFPSDRLTNAEDYKYRFMTFSGKVHYLTVLILIFLISLIIFLFIRKMRDDNYWKRLVPLTFFVLVTNLVFGILWYLFGRLKLFFYWKGFLQKILITNVLVWIAVVGNNLRRLDSQAQENS